MMQPDTDSPEPQRAPHMSAEQFRRLGHRMVDWIAAYLEEVGEYPVRSESAPGAIEAALPATPPERTPDSHDADWNEIFRDLDRIILPGLTHWQSPNFFAYFPANATGPAILGEMLSAGLGVQGMLWSTSPACTEVETRMLDWLADAIGLPGRFRSNAPNAGGVIHGTASEAVLVAMVAARQRLDAAGVGPLVAYASTQAHSSVEKAARIAGLGSEAVHLVEVDESLAMRPDALAEAVRRDRAAGKRPFFICATLGTTSSVAFDPVAPIAGVAQEAGAWLHVDAAYAGAACVCPEHRWMLEGVERADSFNFNPHKWMLTNFDCSAFWTSDRAALLDALSITPEYLRNRASDAGAVKDYRDWQIPLGRRFRALKLWFVMRHYGVEGLRAHIRAGVRLAELFESLVRADDRFEMAASRRLSLVCFRHRDGDQASRALLERANSSGEMFLTHTTLPDPERPGAQRYVLRMAIGGIQTRESHVRAAWKRLQELAG